jgi:cytidylate kinase
VQIAIDGPAGAGKSTIAKLIADRLGILYLDTGAMYRAITYGVLQDGLGFEDADKITAYTADSTIAFDGGDVFLNGNRVTEEIREPLVSRHTSDVACIPGVRALLVARQQAIAGELSVIMDGRDIASVVLPDADYKFYLDASVDERAARRHKELQEKGIAKTLDEIRQDILTRDRNDSSREAGPLVCTPDAVRVDTTGKSIQEVCDEIAAYVLQEA